jgi:putative phage-type endonuclease
MINTQPSIDTSNLTEEEWLQLRRGSIGGSEVAAILGQSKYKTPYQVWLEKTGRARFDGSSPVTEFGHLMEPHLRDYAASKLGRQIHDNQRVHYHIQISDAAC